MSQAGDNSVTGGFMSEPKNDGNRGRMPFGAFLVAKGVITPGDLEAALILQDDRNPKLGRLAHRHQMLTFEKICAVLEEQKRRGISFGQAAVDLGYLSDWEVANLLEEQTANHVYIGELLVELNVMSRAKLAQWLDAYFSTVGEPTGNNAKSPQTHPN
ncbi:MAG: hypothetical protein U1D30_09020 [Planctomycetota bacterium]